MRAAPIALVLMFASSDHAGAQTFTPPKQFTATAFILSSRVMSNVIPRDHSPEGAPFVLWVGIKNTTWRPYALCTTAVGMAYGTSGRGSGHSCVVSWIVLPGETHFERVSEMSLDDDIGSRITATVSVKGRPLASTGAPFTWQLRWEGTVADALALGEWMTGAP